jgi:hypothetical protein
MYSEHDLSQAVDAGVLQRTQVDAFRNFVAAQRAVPAVDEEHFRLVTGFNDIFVGIAAIIALVAAGAIGSGLLTAAVAWGLAEFFTRKRRMAFPSIILLLAFVGGVPLGLLGVVGGLSDAGLLPDIESPLMVGSIGVTVAVITAIATYLHWLRFQVPITVAALTAAIVAIPMIVIAAYIGSLTLERPENILLAIVLTAGLCVFTFAMWWDLQDRDRQTRKSDVAFWLHLLAAPMIAHPLFAFLGATTGEVIGLGGIVAILGVYLLFALVALAVDRRALLVSALAYVLFALGSLFRTFGGIEEPVAITALIIGSALLMLSAFWGVLRSKVVGILPADWAARLPSSNLATQLASHKHAPVTA